MTITAPSGPLVAFGITQSSTGAPLGQVQDYNSQRGPSLFDLGHGMLDPRAFYTYQPGADVSYDVMGFYREQGTVDFTPSSASSNAFAVSSASTPTSGGTITLTPSSAKGTYLTTIVAPETGIAVTVIAIDSTAAGLPFGQDGTINLWNPGAGTGRCISITTSSSGDAGTYSIAGRDMYGYKMTETIATSSVTFTTQKAFKYISAITASTTVTSTGVSIGLSDTYGFPLYVSYVTPGYPSLAMSSGLGSGRVAVAVVASTTNILFGSTVATQTSTTPDVRGTWASSLASNGSNRMYINVVPPALALQGITNTSVATLFGGTQFSSV